MHAGPLWLDAYCDLAFLKKLAVLNGKRNYEDREKISKMLGLLSGEQDFPPWFFDVHDIADHFGLQVSSKMDSIVEKLRALGFKAVKTHFSPTGIKTNAPADVFKRVI